jgi:hypothetical protein
MEHPGIDLCKHWTSPLRLLWIDGDHTYTGTKLDFDGFAPYLADGAIVAIHDVLHEFEGGVRIFMESILLSPNFGAAGLCGSIAWSQYHQNPEPAPPYRAKKLTLYKKLARLVPFVAFDRKISGASKKLYKLYRSRVPRGPIDPETWLAEIN